MYVTINLAAGSAAGGTTVTTPRPAHLALRYASDPAAWPTPPRFDPRHRWYTRLHADAEHEAWLLTWLPGQSTDLHDHGGATGAFLVVAGTVTEDVAGPRRAPRLVAREYQAGQVRSFGRRHIHRVHNAGTEPAVTLHVYTPGLTSMSQYEVVDGELRLLRTDREGTDW
jgi:mannose-6-phosphate isomerase-like protein (cupin superfamily)